MQDILKIGHFLPDNDQFCHIHKKQNPVGSVSIMHHIVLKESEFFYIFYIVDRIFP